MTRFRRGEVSPGRLPTERDHLSTPTDLAGWSLHRLVWVAERGFASAANRSYLTRGGGHYIHAEKLRANNAEAAALARPGRYRTVADNLRVKEVAVAPGGDGDGDQGARPSGSWSATTRRPPSGTGVERRSG